MLKVAASVSVFFIGAGVADASMNKLHEPTIEQKDKQSPVFQRQKSHPSFSWDQSGPMSPILHPGSPRGAGMLSGSLRKIDGVMTAAIDNKLLPGAVVMVARKGHIVKHQAYGHAALYEDDHFTMMDKPVQMRKDTIFDLASISKLFTSTAVMKLYEQGAIDLDERVATYIPEFSQNGKEAITVKQLMTHTSGLPAWVPLYRMGENREDRLQIVFGHALQNQPGTVYTYSDLNMITLGAIVERISGKRLDEFVKETITDPLKMKDTMYNPPHSLKDRIAATEFQPWTDRGLVWGEVHDENALSLDGVAGHAGVFSTAEDLGKFAHMFLNDGRYGDKQILQPESVRLMIENQIPDFPGNDHGLGWELNQGWFMDALAEQTTFGHTGFTGTSIAVSKSNQTIAILLTNRVHPSRNQGSINPVRRAFARLTADAIPVNIPFKGKAWFSGYGDQLSRSLTAKVKNGSPETLTFETWYRTETNADYGLVEGSNDGINYTPISEQLTGSSNWAKHTMKLPEGITYVRFTYYTDSSVNGRGWYIKDISFQSADRMELKSEIYRDDGWELRND
ncbi:serine hydrolase [Bacillus aquiflavi]|uniref:Serine hydrolase n=2 Tax=Bacillus aquiflavi TaxID=2672567 RepID=A0A6B3VZF0_9BACI|nr:serine hydrolase [Bacillus aquiflavi]NEY80724.1 serine hydrolase [Bacillus aquiflavi]UAC50123.1 beta-lactamase family protein [Bacillus aquiflavi]